MGHAAMQLAPGPRPRDQHGQQRRESRACPVSRSGHAVNYRPGEAADEIRGPRTERRRRDRRGRARRKRRLDSAVSPRTAPLPSTRRTAARTRIERARTDVPQPSVPVRPRVHRAAPAKDQAVADVAAAVADGALEVGERVGLPLHRFPLERAADAHDAVDNGAVGRSWWTSADLAAGAGDDVAAVGLELRWNQGWDIPRLKGAWDPQSLPVSIRRGRGQHASRGGTGSIPYGPLRPVRSRRFGSTIRAVRVGTVARVRGVVVQVLVPLDVAPAPRGRGAREVPLTRRRSRWES